MIPTLNIKSLPYVQHKCVSHRMREAGAPVGTCPAPVPCRVMAARWRDAMEERKQERWDAIWKQRRCNAEGAAGEGRSLWLTLRGGGGVIMGEGGARSVRLPVLAHPALPISCLPAEKCPQSTTPRLSWNSEPVGPDGPQTGPSPHRTLGSVTFPAGLFLVSVSRLLHRGGGM